MPLAIELFAGLSGWGEGLAAAGFRVVGFDTEDMPRKVGVPRLQGDISLVIQDVRTLHGRQFADAELIVASPPCQFFSYTAMPWRLAKQRAARTRNDPALLAKELELFRACFRIQREACEATGRHVPLVVENVVGAQAWVGPAQSHFGSYYLWGDIPRYWRGKGIKHGGGSLFDGRPVDDAGNSIPRLGTEGTKVGVAAAQRATKNSGGSWFRVAHNTTSGKGRNPDGRNDPRDNPPYTPHMTNPAEHGSKRKAASALIAKIPYELAYHIGRTYYPQERRRA